MTRTPASIPAGPQQLSTQLLSATLAHELNNIVASLRGFIELGAEQARGQASLQRMFAEVRLGTDRAATLAAELELLAGSGGSARPTPLLQCLAVPASPGQSPSTAAEPDIQWEGDAQTLVLVDPVQVRHAAGLLRRIGADAGPQAPTLRGRIAEAQSPGMGCASCRAPLPARSAWLIQPLPPGRSPAPARQAAAPGHLSIAQWRLAVLAHAAHAAGGHLVMPSEPDSLALVLPLA